MEKERRSFDECFEKNILAVMPVGNLLVKEVVPDNLSNRKPIFIVPGWTEDFNTYKKNMEIGFNRGRRMMSLKYSRIGGELINLPYPKAELRKAFQLLGALELMGIKKTDVIAHSEGAISSVIAASISPDMFENIVFDRPMGFVGRENKLSLAARWVLMRRREKEIRNQDEDDPTSFKQVSMRASQYIFSNKTRALSEALVMTNFDAASHLERIKEKGVHVSIIAGVEDIMSPAKRQISHLEKRGNAPTDGFYPVLGTHNILSIKPDKYMNLALDALDALDRKRMA